MARLLYVEASPRGECSRSSTVARAYLDGFRAALPGIEVDRLDLWRESLPAFDGAVLEAKYAVLRGEAHTPEQADAWAEVEVNFRRFADADRLLFSVPMWNRSIPYRLKRYIDVLTQPGLPFSFSPEAGYRGLVAPKPVVAIYASAGDYGPGSPLRGADFQRPCLEHWLRFVGLRDLAAVTVAPTIGPETVVAQAQAAAIELAVALAAAAAPSTAERRA